MDLPTFTFLAVVVGVVNGRALFRTLEVYADMIGEGRAQPFAERWLFDSWLLFQTMLHLLLWWSIWDAHALRLDFVRYLFLMIGPVTLFLATSVLTPPRTLRGGDALEHFFRVRERFGYISALTWAWAVFYVPVLHGRWDEEVAFTAALGVVMIAVASFRSQNVQRILALVAWVVLTWLIVRFAVLIGPASAA